MRRGKANSWRGSHVSFINWPSACLANSRCRTGLTFQTSFDRGRPRTNERRARGAVSHDHARPNDHRPHLGTCGFVPRRGSESTMPELCVRARTGTRRLLRCVLSTQLLSQCVARVCHCAGCNTYTRTSELCSDCDCDHTVMIADGFKGKLASPHCSGAGGVFASSTNGAGADDAAAPATTADASAGTAVPQLVSAAAPPPPSLFSVAISDSFSSVEVDSATALLLPPLVGLVDASGAAVDTASAAM